MKPEADHLSPIDADDEFIRQVLNEADTATLMLALVHLTGDMSLLRGDIRPKKEFLNPDDGVTEAQRAEVLERAFSVLVDYRDRSGEVSLFVPQREEILEMLTFISGESISEEYIDFLTSELSMHGEDPYSQPAIFDVPEDQRAEFNVVVIGAGMSGILTAIRLQEAGISFTVVDKNPDVGGTWFENTYPGCRVDSANHSYSYSFKPQDWPQHFSPQPVLHEYFSSTADQYGLRQYIRFNTEVTEMAFDEAKGLWRIKVTSPDGNSEIEANAVISAVGQLNRPKVPNINGIESFEGISFHSAEWEHDHDLTGKRIGVIGTGGSAFQFAPVLAESAESLTLFQRTAPWMIPNEDYFEKVPEGKHWLLNHVPFYARWFRFSVWWQSAEGLLPAATAQEGWNRPEESVSELNQVMRDTLVANLAEQFGDRTDLLEKCTPNYPPFAKRMLIDDGKYLKTLLRDNVELVTDGIEAITPKGVRTADGVEHEFDVLIFGTGFKASDFLFPMNVYGLEGKELHDQWDGDPQAYKGVAIPGYPNLFCTYGPNTNIVVNGSIVFFSECEVRYIIGCLALLMEEQGNYMEVKQSVCDEYNAMIEAGNAKMSWGQSGVNTWYKNAKGKITQNWPGTLLEFWQQTREADKDAYRIVKTG